MTIDTSRALLAVAASMLCAAGFSAPPPQDRALPNYSGIWIETRPQSGPPMRLRLTQRGSEVEVRLSYGEAFGNDVFGVAAIQSDNTATWTLPNPCNGDFRKPGYNYDNPGENVFTMSIGQPIEGGSGPILTYSQDVKWYVPCDGHPIGTEHIYKTLERLRPSPPQR